MDNCWKTSLYFVFIGHISYIAAHVGDALTKTGLVGSEVSFQCNYSGRDPWFLVQWRRRLQGSEKVETILTVSAFDIHSPVFSRNVDLNLKQKIIHKTIKRNGNSTFVFKILAISCSDVGDYMCDISTTEGIVPHKESFKLISYPKRPSINYKILVVALNQPKLIDCEGDIGIPAGKLQWYYRTVNDDYFRLVEDEPSQRIISKYDCFMRAVSTLNITITERNNGNIYRCFVKHSLTSSADSKYYDEVTVRLPEIPSSALSSKGEMGKDITYETGGSSGSRTQMALWVTLAGVMLARHQPYRA